MPLHTPALWSPQSHFPTLAGRQIVVVEGEGATLTTADGRTLIDGTSGLWYANIGHGRKDLADVAYEQLLRLETHHTFHRYTNDKALDFAEMLSARAPMDGAKVFFTSGGSESIETACKLARLHWQLEGKPQKRIILSRNQAYHGLHGFGTSIAGQEPNRQGFGELLSDTARVDRDDVEKVAAAVRELGPENIAAIFAEPVQGSGGVITPTPGYLEGLQKIARENDILFVVDEVITGFGRSGSLFASDLYGLKPDMLTFAKGVTSGYIPLGGVFIAPSVADRFYAEDAPQFRHGITYSGHATACAVGIKHMQIIEDEGMIATVTELGDQLERELRAMDSIHKVAEIRRVGLLCGVQLVDGVSADDVGWDAVERGVILKGILQNTVQITPPFVTSPAQISQIVETLDASLAAV